MTPDDAKRIFDEWKQSGESLAAFGRRRGYSAARLYWWRKRLATESVGRTSLSLVPAMVTSVTTPMRARLPNGIGIEVTSATPAWIAAVVAELSRSS